MDAPATPESSDRKKAEYEERERMEKQRDEIDEMMIGVAIRRWEEVSVEFSHLKTNAGILIGVGGLLITISLTQTLDNGNPALFAANLFLAISVTTGIAIMFPQKLITMGIQETYDNTHQECSTIREARQRLIGNLSGMEKAGRDRAARLWQIYFHSALFLLIGVLLLLVAFYT